MLRQVHRMRLAVLVGGTIAAASASAAVGSPTVPTHAEAVNGCNDRTMSYSFGVKYFPNTTLSWDNPNDPIDYDDRAHESIQKHTFPRAQDGSPFLTLTKVGPTSSADVKIYREDLGGTNAGHAECNWPQAIITIDDGQTSNKELWKTGAHEMLHLAGAEHGGRYDEIQLNDNPTGGTRMMTCVSSSLYPNYPEGDRDSIAYLNYLHGNPGYRQLVADSGFENGWDVWLKFGSGAFWTSNSSNPYDGFRRANYAPLATGTESLQGRVRMLTGTGGTEKYRLSARVAPPSSTTPTDVTVKLFTRTANFSGNNTCSYPDGLSSTDPNVTPSLGLWSVVRTTSLYNISSGWKHVSSTWYDPPTSAHAHDFSIWLEGYADAPGTSAPGTILIDDMTVEGT